MNFNVNLNQNSSTILVYMVGLVILFLIGLIIYFVVTEKPIIYGDKVIAIGNRNTQPQEINIKKDGYSEHDNEGIEVNEADKVFVPDSKCRVGQITAATNSNQAAICACFDGTIELNGKRYGKGWFCWN